MQTIRLKVSDSVYSNLMWLLKKFGKDEVQIIEEGQPFLAAQQELKAELASAEKEGVELISPDELDSYLEATIRKYES